MKEQIINILIENQVNEESSTGITGDKIIYGSDFPKVADDIESLIQIVFDPENQPNQLGIKNPFNVIEAVNKMCTESLDPETFQKWEGVKARLIANRNDC